MNATGGGRHLWRRRSRRKLALDESFRKLDLRELPKRSALRVLVAREGIAGHTVADMLPQ